MSSLPPPPPFATPVARGNPVPTDASRFRHPVALFLVAFGLAVLVGGGVGGAVGLTVAAVSNADCTPSDPWCELGGAIFGFLSGVAIGVSLYLAVGIATIHRFRPRGRRAGHIAAHLIAPIAIPMILGLITSIVP